MLSNTAISASTPSALFLRTGALPPCEGGSQAQAAFFSRRRARNDAPNPTVASEAGRYQLAAAALALMSAFRARGSGRHTNQQASTRVPRRQEQANQCFGVEIDRRTTIVKTAEEAAKVVQILRSPSVRDLVHAVDTEVMGWEPGISPYLAGEVFCFSIYCGKGVDFGNGGRLFVDDLDARGRRRGLLPIFQEYFEDAGIKKVFHNYGFDRAQLFREGIDVKGFYADTMHMAQLQDDSRKRYKLSSLGPWRHLAGG